MKAIIRRAVLLFVALVALGAGLCAVAVWHHTRVAGTCSASAVADDVACASSVWFFGVSWANMLVLLALLFGSCLLVAWRWSLYRKRRMD